MRKAFPALLAAFVSLALPVIVLAHGVSASDAAFVEGNQGAAIPEFLYLGAKHMITGYDHLLFLLGVIFFLYKLKDVGKYVTLFTIGHSITLLVGVLSGIHANAYVVDAIIGLSVVYKGFDNIGGFKKFLGFQPNTKIMVMVFGLFHGFGLATKLQEITLAKEGLLTNILSFNVGVEIGQLCALTIVLLLLSYWRMNKNFLKHAFVANTAIMVGGFLLIGYQITGFIMDSTL
jgi:hypothetical protein